MSGGLFDQIGSVGGLVLLALAILSIVGLTISLFKYFQFMQLGVGQSKEATRILEAYASRNREATGALAGSAKTLRGHVVGAVIEGLSLRSQSDTFARERGYQASTAAIEQLNRHMRLLEAIVQSAPMLGLLGTVLGMIDVFEGLASSGGAVDPSNLAEGIWTALMTTAAGLVVAIPFYFITVLLEQRIDQERSAYEILISQGLCSRTGRFERDMAADDRSSAAKRSPGQMPVMPGA
ncbi:MotA/TolQ/ExbB proton channel family protein [Fulvimarina sp. MAC3]|uniref:MotA/TolQ/ExbB proton channel family protein n=1 Tax=Fulvimarina sp. MAC3 TaxID=3148887 RepID=UPI0031FDA07E